MCGIIGYVGPQGTDVTTILLDGLRKLEYRGYDSAGIAVLTNAGDLEVRRRAGKLTNLVTAVENGAHPANGPLGIGHTRWATHGRPNEVNAHPHIDCTGILTVIHNGIIENYLQLKQDLARQGYAFKFQSETDTEVLAHLLEKYILQDGLSLKEAMLKTLSVIKGTAAIVALSTQELDKLVVARLSNAGGVVIGYGAPNSGENYVASDNETAATALVAQQHKVPFIGFRAISDGTPDPLMLPGYPSQFFVYYQLAAENAAIADHAGSRRSSAGSKPRLRQRRSPRSPASIMRPVPRRRA